MSILQPRTDPRGGTRRSTAPLANTNDAVLRATGVLSLLAIGAIHFLQIVPTAESTPLLAVAFLFLIGASLVVAARLTTHRDHLTWIASAGTAAAGLGGYIFTRIFSTPLDNLDVGNWSCMLGLAALFVETTLLAMSVYGALTARAFPAVARVKTGGPSAGEVERSSNAA